MGCEDCEEEAAGGLVCAEESTGASEGVGERTGALDGWTDADVAIECCRVAELRESVDQCVGRSPWGKQHVDATLTGGILNIFFACVIEYNR